MRQNLKFKRASGILLHITSLPGSYGIGEMGLEAKSFIDDLVEMNQSYWQILPTNYPETCNSPYDTNSAFAQNPFIISLDCLIEDGLIDKQDLGLIPKFYDRKVDFEKLKKWKYPILKKAANNFLNNSNEEEIEKYHDFCNLQKFWLDKYALFMVIKKLQNKSVWTDWDTGYKYQDKGAIESININFHGEIEEIKILQYLFRRQWESLKIYAKKRGIQLIGDIPIYISLNSADVWNNQSLFKLDQDCKMLFQSGCPPDHFMEKGQLWGHPIYNWHKHLDSKFVWWRKRINYLMEFVDIIRIDHFNGFAKYWEVPAKDLNAVNGKWVEAKGSELLECIFEKDTKVNLIAEDLGEASADAAVIRNKFDIPGMSILQFALFDENPLAHIQKNTVLYTGTHDNDTSIGWFRSLEDELSKDEINNIREQLDLYSKEVNWSMIEYSFLSKAQTVIVPIQDLLGLGSEARMNTPGTISDTNWSWRMSASVLTDSMKEKMKKITKKAKRI